jgi:hypothetical protein
MYVFSNMTLPLVKLANNILGKEVGYGKQCSGESLSFRKWKTLREAVLRLCDLQKELAQKVEAALKGQIKVYELTNERTRTGD